jgi:hypothetical protein
LQRKKFDIYIWYLRVASSPSIRWYVSVWGTGTLSPTRYKC